MQTETQNELEGEHIKSSSPIGRLVAVSGAQAIVLLHESALENDPDTRPPEMGTLLKIDTPNSVVVGLVSALSVPVPSHDPADPEVRVIEMEFVGEMPKDPTGEVHSFRRGVSTYPAIGHEAFHVNNEELRLVYAFDSESSIRIGTILQESSIPAMINLDDLLGKHFAILGSTGTGKSCATALLLRRILDKSPNAHIVLLDPHREYSPAFGELAEIVTADDLNLPFWLLTFEELVEIVISNQPNREADVEILRELIPMAKSQYGRNQRRGDIRAALQRSENDAPPPSVDTPVPYRISDLIGLINEHIGKLEMRGELAPFKRLKARIEAVSRDPHFSFMFGNLTVQDTMKDILGRLFRVPVNGKPITIIELAGLPAEVINVVVSVLSRMSFDLALWSRGQLPITLVCEEAHRYVPLNTSLGFEPTKRALSRIAKEGRKYGVSLCVVSQRPAEIDPTILSQCNTIFGMRLPNELDQEILRARVSDTSASLLEVLPSLGTGEAVAFGDGVAIPTRMRFDRLPADAMPRSATAQFSKIWQSDVGDEDFLANIVTRWRAQNRNVSDLDENPVEHEFTDAPVNATGDTAQYLVEQANGDVSEVALAEAVSAAAHEDVIAAHDVMDHTPIAVKPETAPISAPTEKLPPTTVAIPEPSPHAAEPAAPARGQPMFTISPAPNPPQAPAPAVQQQAPPQDDLQQQMSSLQQIIERKMAEEKV